VALGLVVVRVIVRCLARPARGSTLTVEYILNLLAHGATVEEVLEEYDGLTSEDIQACLLFATKSLESTVLGPLVMEPA
jgi:uncharacterized protein (DUF433 family)